MCGRKESAEMFCAGVEIGSDILVIKEEAGQKARNTENAR